MRQVDNTSGGGGVRGSSLSAFSSSPRQPMFTPLASTSTLSCPSGPSTTVSTVAAGASSTGSSPVIGSSTPGFCSKMPSAARSSASDAAGTIAGGEKGTVEMEAAAEGRDSASQAWVAVGGSWREEENVCGYWRFSEGAGGAGPLEEGKQVLLCGILL